MADISNSYTFTFTSNVQAQRASEASQAAGGKGNGSYLMALAIMLGEIADKMLDRVMELAGDLDNLQKDKKNGGSGDGENKLTAELQAQTQIMNMFMQAMTTVIKSVGEANKDVARKQ